MNIFKLIILLYGVALTSVSVEALSLNHLNNQKRETVEEHRKRVFAEVNKSPEEERAEAFERLRNKSIIEIYKGNGISEKTEGQKERRYKHGENKVSYESFLNVVGKYQYKFTEINIQEKILRIADFMKFGKKTTSLFLSQIVFLSQS